MTALSDLVIEFPTRELANPIINPATMAPVIPSTEENPNDYQDCKYSGHSKRLLAGMNEQRQVKRFCDVILRCGTQTVEAHRNVLASSSPYFDNLFTVETNSAAPVTVSIQGVDGHTLEELIDFIYMGSIRIKTANVQKLMVAAHLIQLSEVFEACSEFISARLDPSNCLTVLRFADLLGCASLRQNCIKFVTQHFASVLQHNSQLSLLDEKEFGEIISGELISEDHRLDAIVQWVLSDVNKRQKVARALCQLVRISQLSKSYIMRLRETQDDYDAVPILHGFILGVIASRMETTEDSEATGVTDKQVHMQCGNKERILLVGGNDHPRSVECFDPLSATNTVNQLHSNAYEEPKIPALPRGRYACVAVVYDKFVYILGGVREDMFATSAVDILEIDSLRWKTGPPMRSPRAGFGAALLEGKIYAVGGFSLISQFPPLQSAERLTPRTGKWEFVASPLKARMGFGVAVLQGRLYVVGGFDGNVTTSSVEMYNPGTDSWTAIDPMSVPRFGVQTCVLGDRLYAVGGRNGVVFNSAEFYDAETSTWQNINPMKEKRYHFGLVCHDGFLYAIGGKNESKTFLDTVERYDPRCNEWTLLPMKLKQGRFWAGHAVVRMTCPP